MDSFSWFVDNILRWIALGCLVWNVYYLFINKGIPNIRTAPAIRSEIIKLLYANFSHHTPDKPFTLIDLGSGNGLFTREIARALPNARVIGIEISRLAILWARALRRITGVSNLTYIHQDFSTYDLSHADAVVMYLITSKMEPIGQKLHRELKTGSWVTSNHFRLGDGWIPQETVTVRTRYPHQGTFYVYQMGMPQIG